MPNLSAIDHRTRLRQRRLILNLYNYRNCDAEARRQLETKARQVAMVCSKPIYVFREIIHHLQKERIVAPGYSFLQDTVGKALHFEQKRLKAFDETAFQWEQIDKLAHQFKRHLRPILLAVDFAASKAQSPLIEAVAFLKEAFGKGKSLGQYSLQRFPIQFIPDNTKRYLYRQETRGQKHVLPDRYEFLVYRLLRNGLEAGDIFCRDSVRNLSLDFSSK